MTKKVNFDDFTENYNQLLKNGTSFFSSSEEYFAKYKVDIVRERVHASPNNILEYGCGIGRNISFLQQAFPEATIMGSDISAVSLDVARSEFNSIEFILEEESLLLDKKYDLIFVAGVFHHIPLTERAKVAKTLFSRLSSGGELFVFEHNPYNPVSRRIVNNCPYDEDAILLKPFELIKYLSEADFLINQKSYCLFVPPRFSYMTRIENLLGWLPLGGQYWVHATHPI